MPAPQLQSKPLGALGSFGQNSQTSDIDLPSDFGTEVTNAVVNQSGRLSSRKSMDRVTSDNADLTTALGIKRVYRHNRADGTSQLWGSGNNRIFSSDGATLTSRSSGHSADLWQFATLNGKVFAAQASHSLRWFNETTFAETTQATPSNPRAIHSAYGRLWALSSDGWTLYWSVLLDGTDFAGAGSGSLDLTKMHTASRSIGVGIAAFNRQIVVLCDSALIVLAAAETGAGTNGGMNPSDLTTPLFLRDYIPNVGCVARDSIVNTGDDLLFLSHDGVRSLTRSMQEKQGPAPMTETSALNKNVIVRNIDTETTSAIAACWHPGESWYQLFFPVTKEVWVFDVSTKVPQTSFPRTMIWRMGTRPAYCGVYFSDDLMYYGTTGGLARNNLYDADDSYTMTIATGWLSLGAPDSLKHFKKLILSLTGGGGQTATVRWYVDFDENNVRSRTFTLETAADPDEWGTMEWGSFEWSTGLGTAEFGIQLSNSAKFIKIQVDLPVSASEVTVNNAQIFFQMGRVKA